MVNSLYILYQKNRQKVKDFLPIFFGTSSAYRIKLRLAGYIRTNSIRQTNNRNIGSAHRPNADTSLAGARRFNEANSFILDHNYGYPFAAHYLKSLILIQRIFVTRRRRIDMHRVALSAMYYGEYHKYSGYSCNEKDY
jgi:hypothetical protein